MALLNDRDSPVFQEFREFAKGGFCVESIMFLEEVQEFQKIVPGSSKLVSQGKALYDKFISVDGLHQVCVCVCVCV